MTSRERIVNTLLFRSVDRVPFGVGIGFFPWGTTLTRWQEESGISDLNVATYFGYDPGFDIVPIEYGPYPHFPSAMLEEGEEYIVYTDWRGLTVRNRRDGNTMPEFLDAPVKSSEDWEQYKRERLSADHDNDRLAGLEVFAACHKESAVPVQLGSFPWGVFGTVRDLLGTEEFLVGFCMFPDIIRDMMETFTDLWLRLYGRVTEVVRVDHIHIWEDMAGRNGSLISMEMVESFMMPCYGRIVSFAREKGIPLVSVDSDGLVDQLVPVMRQHGINVYFPFEVQAGNDVLEYRKRYPDLGIIGGMDKNALDEKAPLDALHRELDRAEQMLAFGGYIPCFDHLIPPNVPWKKWEYCMDCMKKMIGV